MGNRRAGGLSHLRSARIPQDPSIGPSDRGRPWGRWSTHLLNVLALPEPIRKTISDIVPLNQSVDALKALAAVDHLVSGPVEVQMGVGCGYATAVSDSGAERGRSTSAA
jgi:hypothetical protein